MVCRAGVYLPPFFVSFCFPAARKAPPYESGSDSSDTYTAIIRDTIIFLRAKRGYLHLVITLYHTLRYKAVTSEKIFKKTFFGGFFWGEKRINNV